MPFTPVHSLLALPFIRLKPERLSATALIIGSMAPDFEYFLAMHGNKHHGHTWAGSLYFDVPITILAAFAFHLIVKKNLIRNLPAFFQQRLQTLLNFDFWKYFKKNYIVFIVSAWAGTWSHFFLDSFTHETGFFVRHLHYSEKFIQIQGNTVPLYYLLQMTFSLVGLVALVVYFILLKPTPSLVRNYTTDKKYWISAALVAVCILSIHYGIVRIDFEPYNFIIPTIAAFVGALIICGFLKFNNAIPVPI
jgi:hypothetical protein